jgi:hypothetical protein
MSFILGTWLKDYSVDFIELPDFPCLKQLVAYLQFNMPGSDEERHAKLILVQLEHLAPNEKSEVEEPGDNTEHRRRGLCWAPCPGCATAAIRPGVNKRQGPHGGWNGVWQGILLRVSMVGQFFFFCCCLWKGSTRNLVSSCISLHPQ